MPAQYVFEPQRNQNEDLDQLMTGLVQNVAYRRAQQARKFATAQDMSTKMAAGLIPKADITVTDEGYQFGDEGSLGQKIAGTGLKHGKQRKAFYEAIGGMMGNEDMTRKGGTGTKAKLIDNEAAWQRQEGAAMDARNNTRGLAQSEQNFNNASAYLQDVALNNPTPTPPPGPSPILQPPANGSTVNPAAQAAIQAALGLPPSMAATVASGGGQVAPPANLVQSIVGPTGHIRTSQKDMNADSVDVQLAVPGMETSMGQQAEFSTTKQSARMDAIKTSYMNLMGLSALEGYDNQQMRVGDLNNGAPENNTFQNIAKQRLADIARWEAAALGDGTEQDIKEVGKRSTKIDSSTQSVKATRKGSQAGAISVGNTGGNNTRKAAQYKLGSLVLEENRDLFKIGNDFFTNNAAIKMEDISDNFTVRKSDGKNYVDFGKVIDQLKAITTSGTLPESERDAMIEMSPNAFLSTADGKWYTDIRKTRETTPPASTTYAKMWNKNGEQTMYIDGRNITLNKASVQLAGHVTKGVGNGWQ